MPHHTPAEDDGTGLIAQSITVLLGGLLRRDPRAIGPNQPFTLLGVDAMLGAELVALLRRNHGFEVEPADLYDHPTPADLARYLAVQPAEDGAETPYSQRARPDPGRLHGLQETAGRRAQDTPAAGRLRAEDVVQRLCELLAETLRCDLWEIDPSASFRSLGLDGPLGAEFVAQVNGNYGLDVRADVLFDHPNPAALAAHIAVGSPRPGARAAGVLRGS